MTDQLFSSKISTLPVNIHVMVVDDDATSLAVVSGLLKALNYEVTSFDDPIRALQTLRAGKQSFDLIVTDLYMTKMDGFELTKRIDKEFMLPVIMISSDDRESVMFKAIKEGVVLYLLKPFTQNDLRNIWQFAISTKSRSTKTNPSLFKEETGSHGAEFPALEAYSEEAISVSSTNEGRKEKKKKKYTKKGGKGKNQEKRNDKKVKVVWTDFLQYRFLQAVHYIGLERAVPKKILEVMNVPVLTRENVASHLQKYRIFLRKVGEKCMIVSDNDKTTEEMLLSKFMSRHASLLLKKMQRRNEGNIPQFNSNSNRIIPIPIASSDENPNSPFSRHPNSFLTNPASGFGSYGLGKTTGLMGSSIIPTQIYQNQNQNQNPDFSYPKFPSNNNNNNNFVGFSMGMDENVSIMNGVSNGGYAFGNGNDYMGFESMGMGSSDCLGNGRLISERDEYELGIGIGSGEDSYKWDSMFDPLNFSNNLQPQHDHAPMDIQNGGQEEEADSDFFASLLPLESFAANQNTIQQQGSGTFMEEESHQLYNMNEETSITSPFYIDDQVLDEFLESWLRNDTSAEE